MMVKVDRVFYLLGAPHRVNGKVSGHLLVGHTPVHFTDVDLHAYVVGNDGRAYTAISHIPQPAAQALLPLTPIGGLFGWLFALEKPGWENGFSLTGEQGRGHHCFGGLGFHPVEEDSLAPEPHGWACSVQGSGGWFGLAGLFLRPCDSF